MKKKRRWKFIDLDVENPDDVALKKIGIKAIREGEDMISEKKGGRGEKRREK